MQVLTFLSETCLSASVLFPDRPQKCLSLVHLGHTLNLKPVTAAATGQTWAIALPRKLNHVV